MKFVASAVVMTQVGGLRSRVAHRNSESLRSGKTSAHLPQSSERKELRIASRLSGKQMAVLADVATIHPKRGWPCATRASRETSAGAVITAGQ